MAVASFGECCVLVDEAGRAMGTSLAWFDRRTESLAEAIGDKVGRERIFAITGAALDPTLTLHKLAWLSANRPEDAARAKRVLMMADWIAFRLSGEAATDPSLASRTQYVALHERRWSEELLATAGFRIEQLAPLTASGTAIGTVRPEVLAETGIAGRPVVGVGGHDHVVGAFAAGFTAPGTILDSMGTAEAVLVAGASPSRDPGVVRLGFAQGLVTAGHDMSYFLAGMETSGGTVEWWRSVIGGVPTADLIEAAQALPAGSGGVVFLPHLTSSPPPRRDDDGRGAFVGLATTTTAASLYRAVLEGLAFQARMMLEAVASVAPVPEDQPVRIIGGSTRNPLFLEIKANVFGRRLIVVDEAEATALGAALLGGIAAGLFPDLDAALAGLQRDERIVEPGPDACRYATLYRDAYQPLQEALAPINRRLARFSRAG
jgi:xylulokinase